MIYILNVIKKGGALEYMDLSNVGLFTKDVECATQFTDKYKAEKKAEFYSKTLNLMQLGISKIVVSEK